ncbi:hypothetical protein D3C77_654570 [compost metagenome]
MGTTPTSPVNGPLVANTKKTMLHIPSAFLRSVPAGVEVCSMDIPSLTLELYLSFRVPNADVTMLPAPRDWHRVSAPGFGIGSGFILRTNRDNAFR